MNLINRMLRSLLVIIVVLVTCISLSADWLFERFALSDCFGDCITLLEAQRESELLTRETQTTLKRLLVKSKIAEALQHGEVTLIDAAAFFRSLHEDPKSWHHHQRPRPELKDDEGWCREVIEWTEQYTFIELSPSQADALHQRLETELKKQLAGHGALVLPE